MEPAVRIACVVLYVFSFIWWRRGSAVACGSDHGDTESNSASTGTLSSLPPPWVGLEAKKQGGDTALPTNRKLDEILTECGPAHQNKILSQSFPSGSIHKPLILLYQRADRMKTTITEN